MLVSFRLPSQPLRGARDITARQCIGIFATGQGGETTSAEIGTRDPQCFGIAGKFLGAYPLASLTTGTGVTLPISSGSHRFYLMAMENGATCSDAPLSYFFPDSDSGVANAYAVARSTDVVVSAESQTVSLAPTLYTETNLTPLCGRAAASFCSGYDVCDTFTDTAGTLLSAHGSDVGSVWTVTNLYSPQITSGYADGTANPPAWGGLIQPLGSRDVTVSFEWKAGIYGTGVVEHAYLARVTDANNFLAGVVQRSVGCGLLIMERIANVDIIRASSPLFSCDTSQFNSGRLVAVGTQVTFTWAGYEVTYGQASPALVGTQVGYGVSSDNGGGPSFLDNFRAKRL